MSACVAFLTGALSSGWIAFSIQAAATEVRRRVSCLVEGDLSECFALVLMFNPRVGARWPARFEQGNTYWAEVFEGRD